MAITYRGITIQLNGESTKLQQSLASIRNESKYAYASLRELNRSLKFDDSSITSLTQKQHYLKEAIKETYERMNAYRAGLQALDEEAEKNGGLTKEQQAQHDKLERSIESCKRQIKDYADELKRTEVDINTHDSKLRKFGETAEDVGSKLKSAGQSMSSAGDWLTTHVTVPLTAGATVAIKAATDLDTSYHNLTKTMDGSDEELQSFKDHAVELSKVQPVPATTILDVEALGAQLGYTKDNLEQFATTVTGLDIATNMDAETAAMELAHFANIMGMSQTDTERYGSTIVDLGNHFATTESDISSMAMRIAGAGKQIGLSEADVLGLATALSSMGIEAEAGGTAISTVMSNIDKDVAHGTDSVETWASAAGMSATDFANAWKTEPVKALSALFAGMEEATTEGSNMNLMLENLGITSIRQTDMMKRLASNSSLVGEAVSSANKAWSENTALSNEVANRNESLASKFEILKNRAMAVATEIGEPLANALLAAIDAADPLIKAIENGAQAFADMNKDQQAAIIQMGALVLAAGPVLSVLGRATSGLGGVVEGIGKVAQGIPKFIEGMRTGEGVVGSLNLASEGLGTTLATGLLGVGIAAATVAIGAFIGYLASASEEIEKTRQSHEDFGRSVSNLSDVVHGAESSVKSSTDTIKEMGDEASFTRDDLDALTEANNRLADTISSRNAETSRSVDSLNEARGIIEAYSDKVGLAADEQRKLQDAIQTVNEQCGTSYEVFDAANGKIREQGSDAETTAEQIGVLIDKQIEQVKTNALMANMEDVYKNYYDQLDQLNQIETELTDVEARRNIELAKLNKGDTANAKVVAELNTRYTELYESYNQVNASVQDSVQHLDFYSQELDKISGSSGEAKTALETLVGSTAALHGKLQDDTATTAFATQLTDLGVTAQDYANLSFTQLQQLADSYDGTSESIRGALDKMGVHMSDVMPQKFATFDDALEASGIKLEEFGNVNSVELQKLKNSHDVTLADIVALCSQYGIQIPDTLASQIRSGSTNVEQASKDTGNKTVEGLVNGINEKKDTATTAAANLATDTHKSLNNKLGIFSPSRVFAESGKNVDEGFAGGINDNAHVATNAMADLGTRMRQQVESMPTWAHGKGAESSTMFGEGISSQAYVSASSSSAIAENVRQQLNNVQARSAGVTTGREYATGISSSGSYAINNASNIASRTSNALESTSSWANTSGWNLGINFNNGLAEAGNSIISTARSIAASVASMLHHSTPEEGPLKDDDEWGLDFGQNIIDGMAAIEPAIALQAEKLANAMRRGFNPDIDVLAAGGMAWSDETLGHAMQSLGQRSQTMPAAVTVNAYISNSTFRDRQDIDYLLQNIGSRVDQSIRERL